MKTVTYFHLNGKDKDNADWEISQRNKVAKHQKIEGTEITIYNSMFFTNGVFSNIKL